MKNERAYYAVRDLLVYDNPDTAFKLSIGISVL